MRDAVHVAKVSTSELRAWARENGFTVADRGRLPGEVRDAWEAAQPQRSRRVQPAPATIQVQKPEPPSTPPAQDDQRLDEVLRRLDELADEVAGLRSTLSQIAERPQRRWKRQTR